jgi:hypothetical protein
MLPKTYCARGRRAPSSRIRRKAGGQAVREKSAGAIIQECARHSPKASAHSSPRPYPAVFFFRGISHLSDHGAESRSESQGRVRIGSVESRMAFSRRPPRRLGLQFAFLQCEVQDFAFARVFSETIAIIRDFEHNPLRPRVLNTLGYGPPSAARIPQWLALLNRSGVGPSSPLGLGKP